MPLFVKRANKRVSVKRDACKNIPCPLQVDPNGYGRIDALVAARFLKKSQLSDVILSKIWDMADPQSRGSLDKAGLFVALKLCALAQMGKDLNMSNLSLELPPPKMVSFPS